MAGLPNFIPFFWANNIPSLCRSLILFLSFSATNERNVIQCDLIINEGNSGGALLDSKGRLIGITTFRLKDYSGNVIYGIAFCIPIRDVIDYLNS